MLPVGLRNVLDQRSNNRISIHRRIGRRLCLVLLTLTRKFAAKTKCAWLRMAYPSLTLGRSVQLAYSSRVLISDEGQTEVGDRTHISPFAMVRNNGGTLKIGNDVFIGQGTVIAAAYELYIGDDVLIAENVTIRDQDHGTAPGSPYRTQPPQCCRTVVGNNVWIAAGVVVVKGVTIGDNAIVGAGSVVTRDVKSNTIVVGSPARPLRKNE